MLYISRCQSLLYHVKQSSNKKGFCSFPLRLESRISTLPSCPRIWFSYGLSHTLLYSFFFTQVISWWLNSYMIMMRGPYLALLQVPLSKRISSK